MKSIKLCLSLACLIGVTACAPDLGHDDYNVSDVGQTSTISRGVVVSASPIKIHRAPKGPGTGLALGGVGGALAGSMFGHGSGKYITTGVGALAGAAAGHAIDANTRTSKGMLYEVRLDDGRSIAIEQGPPFFNAGQRVKLLQGNKGGRDRIVPE